MGSFVELEHVEIKVKEGRDCRELKSERPSLGALEDEAARGIRSTRPPISLPGVPIARLRRWRKAPNAPFAPFAALDAWPPSTEALSAVCVAIPAVQPASHILAHSRLENDHNSRDTKAGMASTHR
jgi:hypothetical protein